MRTIALDDSVEKMLQQGGQGSGTQTPPAGSTSGGLSLFLGILELIVVLGIVAAVIYLLVRFLALKTNAGKTHPFLRTLSVHSLASNRSIQLVSLEDRIYVLGVGEDITLLDVITDTELVEEIKSLAPVSDSLELPKWLPKWLPIQKKSEISEEIEPQQFSMTLQSKLEQMKDQRKKYREWDNDNK